LFGKEDNSSTSIATNPAARAEAATVPTLQALLYNSTTQTEVFVTRRLRLVLAAALAVGLAAQDKKIPDLGLKPDPGWPRLPKGWNFGETSGVALDSSGHVYVFNRGPQPLVEFDANGAFIRSLGEGMFVRTHGVRIDKQDNIWAVDVDGHFVVKMNPEGRVVMVLGRRGQAGATQTSFNRPTDVAFADNGDIYVADGYVNSRVVKFSKEGKYLAEWGKKGAGEGEFNLVHTVAVDARGRVYVGDRENHRLQIFDASGKFLGQWKQAGSPWGIEITPDQRLYVADGYANRVLLLNLDGQILGSLGGPGKLPGEFAFVHAVAVSKGGDLYTAEILNWRAQKFVKR
jgi:streptogramin lyase